MKHYFLVIFVLVFGLIARAEEYAGILNKHDSPNRRVKTKVEFQTVQGKTFANLEFDAGDGKLELVKLERTEMTPVSFHAVPFKGGATTYSSGQMVFTGKLKNGKKVALEWTYSTYNGGRYRPTALRTDIENPSIWRWAMLQIGKDANRIDLYDSQKERDQSFTFRTAGVICKTSFETVAEGM